MQDIEMSTLEAVGVWMIIILLAAKFCTGVFVAIVKKEFKWYYLNYIFINDAFKVTAYVVVFGVGGYEGLAYLNSEPLQIIGALILSLGLIAGVIKNIAHVWGAEYIPSVFREPARLRLGNVKNIPK